MVVLMAARSLPGKQLADIMGRGGLVATHRSAFNSGRKDTQRGTEAEAGRLKNPPA